MPRPAPAPPPYPTAGYPAPGYPAAPATPRRPTTPASPTRTPPCRWCSGSWGGWCAPSTAIFAITYGRRAQDEIDASGGTQTGEGMAKAGIVMGWVLLGLYGLMIVGFIVFVVLFSIIGVAASTA